MRSHCVQVGPKFSALLRRPCDDRRRMSDALQAEVRLDPQEVQEARTGPPDSPADALTSDFGPPGLCEQTPLGLSHRVWS